MRIMKLATRRFRALLGGAFLALPAPSVPGQTTIENEAPLTVRISREDCLRLVEHEPAADVEYQPGVDVHGDPVAPADLYPQPEIELPETVSIPIEVDLDERFDLPADSSFKGDVQVGTVEVDLEDGQAYFNGQPLTSPEERYLAERCQQILGGEK